MSRNYKLSIIAVCATLILALISIPPASAAAANRGQGVTLDQLPEELRNLDIQKKFIPGQGVPIGKVRTIRGHLVVRHGNSPQAYFAARGDSLYAHDEIFTLSRSRCRIRYTTADIVTMGANSRIRVDEVVDDRKKRVKSTKMNMLRGKAMFYVMRLLKYNKVDTEVRTPTAVCGVRGTKFGVIVQKESDLLSMRMPLYLADASATPLSNLLADNGGGNIKTTVVTYDGNVIVFSTRDGTSQDVGAGQSLTVDTTGAGQVGAADPTLSQGLDNDTNPDTDTGGTDGDDSDGGDGNTGDNPNAAGEAEQNATNTGANVTQQNLQTGRPAKRIGYFAGMLSKISDYGSPVQELDHIYVSPSSHDHEGPGIVGTDIHYYGHIISLDGAPDVSPTVTQVETMDYVTLTPGSGLGPEHQVKYSELGFNSFLEWGWWIVDVPMTDGMVGTWVIDNAGVYVHGDPTPLDNLQGITGHYVGTAWGTIWSSAGTPGILLMNGTMSADVALGSTVLKNLNVSVSDGGSNWVTIQQEPGDVDFDPMTGTAILEQGNNMNVTIKGETANYGFGSVGLFGTNGEAMGGVVGAESTSYGTNVGFEGTEQ